LSSFQNIAHPLHNSAKHLQQHSQHPARHLQQSMAYGVSVLRKLEQDSPQRPAQSDKGVMM